MMAVLDGLTPEQMSQDLGSFYKSIIGMLNHMLRSDIGYLRRWAGFFEELSEIASSLPEMRTLSYEELEWETYDNWKPVRTMVDDLIKQAVDLITEDHINERVSYIGWRGEEVNKDMYHLMMHLFNHQTHHRGGIAVLLDILGVENDFSGMMGLNH